MVQHIGVGGADGVADHLVAHITLVHIRILRVGARPRRIGGKNHAREVELTRSLVHPNTMFGQGVRQHIRDAIFPVGCWIVRAHFILVKQFKRAMWVRQSHSGEYFGAVRKFSGFGFEEFTPCRRVEIHIRDLNSRTDRACGGGDLPCARVVINAGCVRIDIGFTGQTHLRDRRDGSQSLTAKAHGFNVFELVQRANFTGGVARDRQGQLCCVDAAAIVRDFN